MPSAPLEPCPLAQATFSVGGRKKGWAELPSYSHHPYHRNNRRNKPEGGDGLGLLLICTLPSLTYSFSFRQLLLGEEGVYHTSGLRRDLDFFLSEKMHNQSLQGADMSALQITLFACFHSLRHTSGVVLYLGKPTNLRYF